MGFFAVVIALLAIMFTFLRSLATRIGLVDTKIDSVAAELRQDIRDQTTKLDTKIDSVAAELRQDIRDQTVRIDEQTTRIDDVVLTVGSLRGDIGELRGDIRIIQNHLGLPRTA